MGGCPAGGQGTGSGRQPGGRALEAGPKIRFGAGFGSGFSCGYRRQRPGNGGGVVGEVTELPPLEPQPSRARLALSDPPQRILRQPPFRDGVRPGAGN